MQVILQVKGWIFILSAMTVYIRADCADSKTYNQNK